MAKELDAGINSNVELGSKIERIVRMKGQKKKLQGILNTARSANGILYLKINSNLGDPSVMTVKLTGEDVGGIALLLESLYDKEIKGLEQEADDVAFDWLESRGKL